jgi:hypothetical protein
LIALTVSGPKAESNGISSSRFAAMVIFGVIVSVIVGRCVRAG